MKVSSLLGLKIDEIAPMLVNWVNENYGTELSHVQWNWVL
jgi:hypothetical protein